MQTGKDPNQNRIPNATPCPNRAWIARCKKQDFVIEPRKVYGRALFREEIAFGKRATANQEALLGRRAV